MSAASTLVAVVPNDFLFRSFLKSSCFGTHSYPTSFSLNQRRPYFRIFSLSTKQPQRSEAPVTTTTTTTTTTSKRKSVAIYLMERLGFSQEQSLSISKKFLLRRARSYLKQVTDLISFEKADSVITYLQGNCGLDLSQVKKLITKHPIVLTADADKTIKPKIKLLQDLGFSNSDLALVLSANPDFYLERDLTPVIQALRGIVGSDEYVVRVFKVFKYGNATNFTSSLIRNVNMLENEYGITRDKLIKFLTKSPQSLLRKTEWLRDVLVRIEDKWGITRDSAQFLRAIYIFCSLSDDTINSKCQVFRSYRWSDSDIQSLIRRHPECLGLSEGGIKNKLDFYMKELGYDPAYMASRPALIAYSLENRVVPRHRVLLILKEKGFIKATSQLYSYLIMSEDRFFDTYILPYEKLLPNLRDVYINMRAPSEVPLIKEAYENGS